MRDSRIFNILFVILFSSFMVSCTGSVGREDAGEDGGDEDIEDTADGDTGFDVDVDFDLDLNTDVEVPPTCGNGTVDEGEECDPPGSGGRSCTTSCGSSGSQFCNIACWFSDCIAPEETCNGVDDDCDGQADNGFECAQGSTVPYFTYCGIDVPRTCDETCTWGDIVLPPPPDGCNNIVVPYMEPPLPPLITLVFSSAIRQADVYFLVDTTGTMWQEMGVLQGEMATVIIPGMTGAVEDLWMGVGYFEDYPVSPFGSTGDVSYRNLQDLSANPDDVVAAVMSLERGGGSDYPESHVVALWTIATGDPAATIPELPSVDCEGAEFFGYPCFRRGSIPVILLISDANFHNGPGGSEPYDTSVPAPTYDEAADALIDENIEVTSIFSGRTVTDADFRALAIDTGAVDQDGNPLVFTIPETGTNLGNVAVTALQTLLTQVPRSVAARARDDASDTVDATLFIERIEPNVTDSIEDPDNPGVFCEPMLPTADTDGDGYEDTFTAVLPGTALCFNIIPAANEVVPSAGEAQVFRVFIDIVGDGITGLDTRDVYFIVP